jgi:F-type H+-transporting ATPase subunit a
MDHHTSWFSFLPGYSSLLAYFQDHYGKKEQLLIGNDISTVHHILAALLVALILLVGSLIARGRLSNLEQAVVPERKLSIATLFELFTEAAMGTMASIIGPKYKQHVPFVATMGLFVLVSNLLGLIPGMLPPTDNLNTTMACGLIVFVYFNVRGFQAHGIGHITHLLNPVGKWWGWFLAPLLGVIEIVSLCVRPVTLGIRLCANMIGDHAVLLAFAGIFPLLVPLPFYILGLLVCVIQTAVFMILTCVYISLHTADTHGDDHAHADAHAH